MAIDPETEYPGRVDAADADYPHGAARNQQGGVPLTGTPLDAAWINDIWGFLQSILGFTGVAANGTPDTAQASQYRDQFDVYARSLAPKLLDEPGPKFIANGGLSLTAPNNTIPAIEAAAEAGYWGVIIHTRETSDGEWVLMYDDEVDAMTDGTGAVNALTLAQIKALAVDLDTTNYPNLRVPTLREALRVCKHYDIVPIVDLRRVGSSTQGDVDAVTTILLDEIPSERCMISGDSFTASNTRNVSSSLTVFSFSGAGWLTGNIDVAVSRGNVVYTVGYDELPSDISYATDRGVKVGAVRLGTGSLTNPPPNHPLPTLGPVDPTPSADIQTALDLGVEYVITDGITRL